MAPSSPTPGPSRTLRDYTSIPLEVLIALLTILPFFVLAWFYPVLPDRVPLFMHVNGEVAQWGEKTLISVFRVPLIAALIQIVCLLMKYGGIQSIASEPREVTVEQERFDEQSLRLYAGLWDWLRWSSAFKMSAESVDTIFLSFDLKSFSRPVFIFTAIAALVGVAGALYYLSRLIVLKRQSKLGASKPHNPIDPRHVYGGILYFNKSDSALFSQKYIFNFGNKWVWVLIACIVAYPVLVFWPS